MKFEIHIAELLVQRELGHLELRSQIDAAIRPHLPENRGGSASSNRLSGSVADSVSITLRELIHGDDWGERGSRSLSANASGEQ